MKKYYGVSQMNTVPDIVVIDDSVSSGTKWIIAFIIALLFIVFANPYAFKVSNCLFGVVNIQTWNGCYPTWAGVIIHAIIFLFVIRLLMW